MFPGQQRKGWAVKRLFQRAVSGVGDIHTRAGGCVGVTVGFRALGKFGRGFLARVSTLL